MGVHYRVYKDKVSSCRVYYRIGSIEVRSYGVYL